MKKKIIIGIVILALITACLYCFVHIWSDPTCTEPQICKICRQTKGNALGHNFTQPTCTEPSVCTVCAEKGEAALGHAWINIGQNYRICTRCNIDEGEKYDYESQILCNHVILYNVTNNFTVYSAGEDERCYPASTTKLITACLTMQYLNPDEVIEVGSEIYLIKKNSSTAGLRRGYKMTVRDLLKAMLIPSGNDAAYVLAYNVALKNSEEKLTQAGYIDYFIQMMNDFVIKLGAGKSNFVTPDGYDDVNQYTTPHDMLLITLEALKYQEIKDICATEKIKGQIYSGQSVNWKTSNLLLSRQSGYYYKYATGLKTGSTEFAGKCLTATAEKDDDVYVAVVMGGETEAERFGSAKILFESVLGN